MSKRDLRRVIDGRPTVTVTAAGVVVMPSNVGNWLAADGSVPLSGDLDVLTGVTVDGVDISELAVSVEALVGANTITRTGYTVMGHGTNLADPAPDWIGYVKVWEAVFALNELVALSDTLGQIEYMRITSAATATTNYAGLDCYQYSVTRRIETNPAGLNISFPAGTMVYGLTDRGYIAFDNRYGRPQSPSMRVILFNDSPATLDAAERIVQIGNLRGTLGLDEDQFGAAFGRLTTGDRYVVYNAAQNLLRMRNADLEILNAEGERVFWVNGASEADENGATGYTAIGRQASQITIDPEENRVSIWVNGREVIWFDAIDGSRIAGLLGIGSPTGPQVQLGELDGEAVIQARNLDDKVQFLVRTNTPANSVHVHMGNPKPEPGWWEFDNGVATHDGIIRARGGQILGRLDFGSTGEVVVLDPDDARRYGHILPHGIVGYSVDALDAQYAAAVDAWAPLHVTYAPGLSRTWLAGEGYRGDWRYRHFRWERGAGGRVGLFNGDTGVAYLTASGWLWAAGEVHAANDRVALGEPGRGVRIARIDATDPVEEIKTESLPDLSAESITSSEPAVSLLAYMNSAGAGIWGLNAWKEDASTVLGTNPKSILKIASGTPIEPDSHGLLQLRTVAEHEATIHLYAVGDYDKVTQQSASIYLWAARKTGTAEWNHSRIRLEANVVQLYPFGTNPSQSPESLSSGLFAFADPSLGPDYWNPGCGKGLYHRMNGYWVPLVTDVGMPWRVAVKTDTYTATAGDDVIVCNKGTAMTVNLPAATGSGKRLTVKNVNVGTVTVDGSGSETIDGATTQSLSQWQRVQLLDYASGAWVIL